nr:alpha/beta hydrolase-fold protein [Hyphomonas sp. Mor2]
MSASTTSCIINMLRKHLLLPICIPFLMVACAHADTESKSPAQTPYLGQQLEARSYLIPNWEWEHEVRIYLPASYSVSEQSYPTIWVTDNLLEIAVSAAQLFPRDGGVKQEFIVVAIGAPRTASFAEYLSRRNFDFSPEHSQIADILKGVLKPEDVGGADAFMQFLVEDLRQELSAEFRMDPKGHAFVGHSGGAMFGLYTLFSKPDSFSRYLLSSPATREPWLAMESDWHKANDDLKARVYLSAGGGEANIPLTAGLQVLSATAAIGERLQTRGYDSLVSKTEVFDGEDHSSVIPRAYYSGIAFLYNGYLEQKVADEATE